MKVQAHGRVEHSAGSGSRDVQPLPVQDASLDYPTEHTLSSPGAGAGEGQRGSGAREAKPPFPRGRSGRDRQDGWTEGKVFVGGRYTNSQKVYRKSWRIF